MSTPYLEFLRAELAPGLMEGLWVSVLVIVPSALLGVLIGLTAGVLRVYGPTPVRKITEAARRLCLKIATSGTMHLDVAVLVAWTNTRD